MLVSGIAQSIENMALSRSAIYILTVSSVSVTEKKNVPPKKPFHET